MRRGIEARHEIDPTLLLRDTRTLGKRISDFFSDPTHAAIVLLTLAIICVFLPELSFAMLLMGVILFFYGVTRKKMLPFRLPKVAQVKDFNDLKPGIKLPNIARGIAYFGNDLKSNEELWFANEDMRTHGVDFWING